MTTVTINGVPIKFPFEPYELQKVYMEKVLDCLQNETNGVLESPTGTGKTLSLLCSSLAWLELKKAQLQVQQSQMPEYEDKYNDYMAKQNSELEKTAGRSFLGLPTIIYASRTHSQLSQAMQELKRSSYKHMKACVLGSREQMCIHPELASEQNFNVKTQMCQLKVKTRSCHYYNRVERKKEDPAIRELTVVDLEDIVKLGTTHKFCPYFMSKELKQQADIIFMPYNYLLDPRARKALGVVLSNNVVILDEAHNIERICEESASLQIKASDIALAIEEATAIMKLMSDDAPLTFDNNPKDFTAEDLCILKQILLDFEKELDAIKLKNTSEGTTFEGSYVFDFLAKVGVEDNNSSSLITIIGNIITYLATVSDGPFARRGVGLQLFEDFLRIVFMGSSPDYKDKVKRCCKVHITQEEVKKKNPNNWLTKAAKPGGGKIFNYWCLSPGFGMNMLMAQGLKSLILTSGTLAPLKPLISELELNVQVRLENPHIVKSDQICVKIITTGPDMETLNCSYQNRDNPKYIGSLGRSILNLTRIIPNGLLIFFPSYPIMLKCKDYWQESGIWSSINDQKAIYVEPKDKDSFNTAMHEYYAKIQDPNLKGAIFMGVCRGKVSEGLDFADANGRAVIVTGLPYPPLKDPRVILKKRYLDICNVRDKEFLKGDEWYSLEASRAINQAIGRVIRHRDDYGAILLMDTRFNNFRIKNQMSLWLRDHITVPNNFGEIIRDLRVFFKNAQTKFPAPKIRSKIDVSVPATFEIPSIYKKSNFDFTTSSVASTSSLDNMDSTSEYGEVEIHKRTPNDPLKNSAKRKKISLIPNASKPCDISPTTTKEYILMVRKSLDQSSFQEFTTALKMYKDTEQFCDLVSTLDKIFISKPTLRYIIQGLEPYIKENDKSNFNDYWNKMR